MSNPHNPDGISDTDMEILTDPKARIAELEDELEAAQIGETAQKKRAERLQRMVDTSEYDHRHPGIFWKGLYEQAEAENKRGYRFYSMCQDGHERIGWKPDEWEECPVCRAVQRAEQAERGTE